MTRPALRIRNIGKQYQIGLQKRRYETLRETLVDIAKAPWRRLRHLSGQGDEDSYFWALRDVNLDIQQGDVVGIIGHNGAGKSTLLKILSQITEPTTGEVEIHGRIGSLLEVGTGFHPELTGRENIYVNGAILGMTRAEVKRKFDEIVEFSGVDRFLETPVKRYSSGMVVRLAFAVAAHLEPEILVVDEVLAVGDQEFQSKCLGKMGEVAGAGRTVLFVSHNMAAVESLCHRACLLEKGRLVATDGVSEIIRRYLDSGCELDGNIDLSNHPRRPPQYKPLLMRMRILNGDGRLSPAVRIGDDIRFELDLYSMEPVNVRLLGIRVMDSRGLKLFTCRTNNTGHDRFTIHGDMTASCTVRNLRLVPGRYSLHLMVVSGHQTIDEIAAGLEFEVLPLTSDINGNVPAARAGVIVAEEEWDIAAGSNANRPTVHALDP